MQLDEAKQRLAEEVDKRAEALTETSHRIHERPELLFEERYAADLLCSALDEAGLAVERGAYGLDTAFVARAGTEGPTIAVLCEYDALPGLGHGCGHNLIGTSAIGAGSMSVEPVAKETLDGGRWSAPDSSSREPTKPNFQSRERPEAEAEGRTGSGRRGGSTARRPRQRR